MKKFIPQNFNDFFALLVAVVIIPLIWILQGVGVIKAFPSEVNGALILAWGNIIQFYYRRAKKETAKNGKDGTIFNADAD